MPYFAATFARTSDGGWAGGDVDLDEVEGLEELAALMRDRAEHDEPVLLLLEEDDEWFSIVRVDDAEDPRVFLSDLRAPLTSHLAALVHEGIARMAETEEEEEPVLAVAGEPGGDADLLEDFGMPSDELVDLCVEEGLLPADVLSTVAERAAFADELDKLR